MGKKWLFSSILVLGNILFPLLFAVVIERAFRRWESFIKAFLHEIVWFLFLFLLMIFNFYYEKKVIGNRKFKLSFALLTVDFLIISPFIYFTLNELFK
ncbi:hypothetical protein ASG01_01550 [Chryseobacterium sp. Leaf180]|nr:hypothetical protein ASG01_01550 [Chryseobacterium sp. Leaf180]